MAIITFEELISAGRMWAIKRVLMVYFMYLFLRLLENDVIRYMIYWLLMNERT